MGFKVGFLIELTLIEDQNLVDAISEICSKIILCCGIAKSPHDTGFFVLLCEALFFLGVLEGVNRDREDND